MNKPLFDKVTIVGVGLIGGSLGLAIKKRKLAKLVMGVVHRRRSGLEAMKKGAVHGITMNLRTGLADADLVLLCSPVSTIVSQMKDVERFAKPGALIMDVASSKMLVGMAAKKYIRKAIYIGSHPMAGSSMRGAKYSSPDLFENAICFLTCAHRPALEFWHALGSKTHILTPQSHDEWVARVSHLPHILAFALFQSSGAKRLERLGIEASNPSIQDLARLSKSDPKLWADILLSNKTEILRVLEEHELSIRHLKKALTAKNSNEIQRFITRANMSSQRLAPEKGKR